MITKWTKIIFSLESHKNNWISKIIKNPYWFNGNRLQLLFRQINSTIILSYIYLSNVPIFRSKRYLIKSKSDNYKQGLLDKWMLVMCHQQGRGDSTWNQTHKLIIVHHLSHKYKLFHCLNLLIKTVIKTLAMMMTMKWNQTVFKGILNMLPIE